MSRFKPVLPLIQYNAKHLIRISSPFWLTHSDYFFENGGFREKTFFIDSSLNEYEIFSVSKSRLSFNIVHLTGWINGLFWYKANYELSDPVQISFDELKVRVIDLVVRKRWYAQGGQTRMQFTEAFNAFANMQDLMANISAYGDPPF